MRAANSAVRFAMLGIMALLAACASDARFEAAPPLALGDPYGADMFGGKRRYDPFERSLEQRPQAWTLFGRLGVIHYQNQLDRDSGGEITLKRSGPSIGRISIGLRRRF